MKIKISHHEIGPEPDVEAPSLPKYIRDILNKANRWSQGTQPKVVGQVTDLFKEFPGNTVEEWESWYLQREPDGISQATDRILEMVEKVKDNLGKLDRQMVEDWTRYLVIVQTFKGLRRHKAVLKRGADIVEADYRIATAEEEKKGIDGYIDGKPVSIKPETYKLHPELRESLPEVILYYQELDDGIEVDYSALTEWKSKNIE